MKILNLNAFVKVEDSKQIGIAINGTFAASGWLRSNEAFNAVRGRKFSWYGPDGNDYVDDRGIFVRPTEQEVLSGMTNEIKLKALELGYAEP